MAKGRVVTEEQVIARAQYLDLVYTQSGTLYDKIPDASRPEFSIPPPPKSNNDSHVGDGVIGTVSVGLESPPSVIKALCICISRCLISVKICIPLGMP